MELKSYQRKVIDDLDKYLKYVQDHKNLEKAFQMDRIVIVMKNRVLYYKIKKMRWVKEMDLLVSLGPIR